MSLFLGPIHHWLWNKIQFQNSLNYFIFEDYPQVQAKVADKIGRLSTLPLEDQIDPENIHGWLQDKIILVETAYAYGVSELIDSELIPLTTIQEKVYNFGKNNNLAEWESPKELYEELTTLLLDGMPCDNVNQILEFDDNKVVWQRNQCVHSEFWQRVNLSPEIYYQLRKQLISGLLLNSGYIYKIIGDNSFALERINQ